MKLQFQSTLPTLQTANKTPLLNTSSPSTMPTVVANPTDSVKFSATADRKQELAQEMIDLLLEEANKLRNEDAKLNELLEKFESDPIQLKSLKQLFITLYTSNTTEEALEKEISESKVNPPSAKDLRKLLAAFDLMASFNRLIKGNSN